MMEKEFLTLSSQEFEDLIGDELPAYMDNEYAFFRLGTGDLVVAPVSFIFDRAVREAGFATEPLRHLVAELYSCLYLRMLEDPVRGFTHQEWEACQEAREVLGLPPAHSG